MPSHGQLDESRRDKTSFCGSVRLGESCEALELIDRFVKSPGPIERLGLAQTVLCLQFVGTVSRFEDLEHTNPVAGIMSLSDST